MVILSKLYFWSPPVHPGSQGKQGASSGAPGWQALFGNNALWPIARVSDRCKSLFVFLFKYAAGPVVRTGHFSLAKLEAVPWANGNVMRLSRDRVGVDDVLVMALGILSGDCFARKFKLRL